MVLKNCLFVVFLVGLLAPGFVFAGGDAAKGKQMYNQYCATCHGLTGKGDGQAAAALNPKPRDFTDKGVMGPLSDDDLFKVIQGGGAAVGKSPMMPPWGGSLKDQDIRDVISYIRGLSG